MGGILTSGLLNLFGLNVVALPVTTLVSGSFLFGTVFVATEPVSGAKTKPGQGIYGFMIGTITVALRGYSNFAEGMMFSVLLMNAFVSIIDQTVRHLQADKKVAT